MSIFATAASALRSALHGGKLDNPEGWVESAFGVPATISGVEVNEVRAMNYSSIVAAVRVLAESRAQLPLQVFRRVGNGRERARERNESRILGEQPNPEMSAFTLAETQMAHVALWGNSYSELVWDGSGRLAQVWPIAPNRVTVRRVEVEDGAGRRAWRLVYDVTNSSGPTVTLQAEDVLHVPGLSFDGLRGRSPVSMAREAIALGLAAEAFGAAFFGNGSQPGGFLKYPGKLDDPSRAKIREAWEETHRGPKAAHRVAVFEGGLDWVKLGVPPDEAQFLETRRYQNEEIARIYRIPLYMLGDLTHATFSNVEELALQFIGYTLLPWLIRFEQEINRKIFGPGSDLYVKHEVKGFLRGNLKSRFDAYAIGRQWGWLSADDVRESEDENPLPNGAGTLYLHPVNMAVAGLPAPPAASKAAPAVVVGGEEAARAVTLALVSARRVFGRAVDRFIAREAKALGRLAGEDGGSPLLAAPLGQVRKFYQVSEPILAREAADVSDVFGWCLPASVERSLSRFASEYCAESLAQVEEIAARGEGWGAALTARVEEWRSSRAAVSAAVVFGREGEEQ